MTLHEAMIQVLREAINHIMHADMLSEEIFKRELYRQKDGDIAPPSQIKLRAKNYANLFEIVDKSYIKLIV